ncbi:MAG: hypothetical protein R2783_06465 [Gelidibacter sp.]
MKSLLLFSALIVTFSFTASAQSVEGVYTNKWKSPSGEALAYELILHEDGSFTFYSTRTYLDSDPDKTTEVDGTWTLDGHLLVLNTNHKTDNALTTGLDNNKAKYVNISPRNPNFNLIKPSLRFYESGVFFAKDMELFKTESKSGVTSSDEKLKF